MAEQAPAPHEDRQSDPHGLADPFEEAQPLHGDPDGDRCRKFLAEYSQLAAARHDPLYALPRELIAALEAHAPGFFTEEERAFEHALHAFCAARSAVGITDNSFIQSTLLHPPAPPQLSQEDLAFLGMNAGAQGKVRSALERAEAPRELARAYAGWLLTEPAYLQEREKVRQAREKARQEQEKPRTQCEHEHEAPPPSFVRMSGEPVDAPLVQFLQRWQLSQLDSWDLPAPSGPNLSGLDRPASASDSTARTHWDMPVTMRLPDRYPLREILTEARRTETPHHLNEWQKVLDGKYEIGLTSWRHIFLLHFYRDLALAPRYEGRFKGRVQQLDEAFGLYLGLGEDQVKKLRLRIGRRLKAGTAAPAKT